MITSFRTKLLFSYFSPEDSGNEDYVLKNNLPGPQFRATVETHVDHVDNSKDNLKSNIDKKI